MYVRYLVCLKPAAEAGVLLGCLESLRKRLKFHNFRFLIVADEAIVDGLAPHPLILIVLHVALRPCSQNVPLGLDSSCQNEPGNLQISHGVKHTVLCLQLGEHPPPCQYRHVMHPDSQPSAFMWVPRRCAAVGLLV